MLLFYCIFFVLRRLVVDATTLSLSLSWLLPPFYFSRRVHSRTSACSGLRAEGKFKNTSSKSTGRQYLRHEFRSLFRSRNTYCLYSFFTHRQQAVVVRTEQLLLPSHPGCSERLEAIERGMVSDVPTCVQRNSIPIVTAADPSLDQFRGR